MFYVFEDTLSVVSQKPTVMKRSYSMENLKNICPPKSSDVPMQTVSFDWFLSGLELIINLEFCLLKLLRFYQKLL